MLSVSNEEYLENNYVPGAAFAAVEGYVLVASVRVKPADALLAAQKVWGGGITE